MCLPSIFLLVKKILQAGTYSIKKHTTVEPVLQVQTTPLHLCITYIAP